MSSIDNKLVAATLLSVTMDFRSLLLSLITIGISAIVLHLLHLHFLVPASITRKLRQQGVHVLPYRPFAGNASESRRLQKLAAQSDLPSPFHHDIIARILPFYSKIFSQISGRTFVYWWGAQPRLVVTNPEDVKRIMSADVKNYSKSQFGRQVLHRLFGNGLVLAEGDDWHNQRALLRPAFFAEKLKAMVADMHLSAVQMTNDWAEIIAKAPSKSAEVEVAYDLRNATADILARTCFGSDYESGKEVFGKQELLLDLVFQTAVANALIPGYKFLPLPSNLAARKIENSIDEHLCRVVKSRMESFTRAAGTSVQHTDLLSLILAGDETDNEQSKKRKLNPLNAQQIIAECRTFFFAGHETTANLLAWTMMLLSLYPEWQERVRDEVEEVCGDGDDDEPLKADQLNKLKLLGMVLYESLRLYPPVPILAARRSNSVDKVGELDLPQGMGFTIPTLYIHRDTALWGDDADHFRPQRFQDGVSKACKHPSGFLPFGVGPRICIGQNFALLEAKALMVVILQRFRFRLSPNYRHAPETMITMRPKHGMQLILQHAH